MENIPADYWLILCIKSYWPVLYDPLPAPYGGRFPGCFLILFSLPVTAEFSSQPSCLKAQVNRNRYCLFFLSPMLPVAAVSEYLSQALPDHNPHLLSISHRTPAGSYMPLPPQTAFSLMGSLSAFGSIHGSPCIPHFSLPGISLLPTVRILTVSCPCNWSGFLRYVCRNSLPRSDSPPASAVVWGY